MELQTHRCSYRGGAHLKNLELYIYGMLGVLLQASVLVRANKEINMVMICKYIFGAQI